MTHRWHTVHRVLGLSIMFAFACGGESSTTDAMDDVDLPGSENCENSMTPYRGDCFRLEPPDPSEGFQLHYGPSEYTEEAMAPYLLQPGEEIVDCLYMTTPNDEDIYFQEYETGIRHGTHHVILWVGDGGDPDGTRRECDGSIDSSLSWMLSAQGALGVDGVIARYPGDLGGLAAEDEGSARIIAPRSKVAYQVHFVNTTDEPILRESWANIYYKPPAEVDAVVDTIAWIGGFGLAIEPGATVVETATCRLPLGVIEPLRIRTFIGHTHAHGTRFTAWKVDAEGERTQIYETYDWNEPDNIRYDSITQNPVPDRELRLGGGFSGELTLGPGERIDYECEYFNDTDQVLRWANEAYTAEMCNFIGTYSPSFGSSWDCQNR